MYRVMYSLYVALSCMPITFTVMLSACHVQRHEQCCVYSVVYSVICATSYVQPQCHLLCHVCVVLTESCIQCRVMCSVMF